MSGKNISKRKTNKKSARIVSKSELEFAFETDGISADSKYNASSFDQASYIYFDVEDRDEISRLRQQRRQTFKQNEAEYKRGLDEYVELRSTGQPTIKKNGKLSHTEPPREKDPELKVLTKDILKKLFSERELINNLDSNLTDLEFENIVIQTSEYTSITYCKMDFMDVPLKNAFFIINELGWDVPITRNINSSILDGSVEFSKGYLCHHFVYFGDIVKPSRSGKTLESYDPSVEFIPVKLQVFSNDSSSTVLKKETPFELLLFSDEEGNTVHVSIINSGCSLKQ